MPFDFYCESFVHTMNTSLIPQLIACYRDILQSAQGMPAMQCVIPQVVHNHYELDCIPFPLGLVSSGLLYSER